jgi:pyruvate-formate lyase-activating enzyme
MGIPDVQAAETCVGTRALGPGLRSAVWVQGCPFRCTGCIAPDWIPPLPGDHALLVGVPGQDAVGAFDAMLEGVKR